MADAAAIAVGARRIEEASPLKQGDVVITVMSAVALAYLVVAAPWSRGFVESAVVFAVIGLGPPLLRALAWRFPRAWPFSFAADFWLLPSSIAAHGYLGPIVDSVQPALLDRRLALADLRLLGAHPGVLAEQHAPPWLIEILIACYYTYFLWPVLVGLVFWIKRERRVFDEYLLALSLLFSVNFIGYALVPAIGPRFFLAGEFTAPLRGVVLTPLLDSVMRNPEFMRDCFPSGHTAVTLLVLTFAFRHARRAFWVMLPFGSGLIAATVVCRFHYAVDLLAAVPAMLACLSLAALARPRLEPQPAPARGRTRPEPARI